MDIGKAFGFVQQDERWVTKILIGGLIMIGSVIPVVGIVVSFLLIGYMLKTARNVALGSSQPLPEWNDFGDLLKRGFYTFVIQIVYLLPVIVLYFVLACIGSALGASVDSSADSPNPLFLLAVFVLGVMILIAAIIGGVASYSAQARYAATDTLSEAMKVQEVLATLRTGGPWTVLGGAILAGIVAMLGIIACGVGVLFTSVYAYVVIGHLVGQLAIKQGLTGGNMQSVPPYTPPYTPPTSSF